MSQYNLNGFNRSPYNIKPEYNVSWAVCTFSEKITGLFGTFSQNYFTINAYERVSCEGRPTPVRFKIGTGSEAITANLKVESVIFITKNLNESVAFLGSGPSNVVHLKSDFSVLMNNESSIGFDFYLNYICEELITESSSIGSNRYNSGEGFELVSSVSSAEAVQEYICNIDTQLQPGSTLVIDANNYNVLIDGENAIWAQSGDWLDNLNRDTINIAIQAASGGDGLTATILYTERYL